MLLAKGITVVGVGRDIFTRLEKMNDRLREYVAGEEFAEQPPEKMVVGTLCIGGDEYIQFLFDRDVAVEIFGVKK